VADDRVVVCEHKLEARETPFVPDAGEIKWQLERYLALPIDGVAYFRSSLAAPSIEILGNCRYLHPPSAPHFLWRDLYGALSTGEHDITRWLFEGFRRLGFTPPLRHLGELWPDDSEDVRDHQRNFAKLWDRTRAHAFAHWRVNSARRCELSLRPRSPGCVTRIHISPLAQGGSLLRFRVETDPSHLTDVRARLEQVVENLPAEPDIVVSELADNVPIVDLLASLHAVLGTAHAPADQEERLFRQVIPALDSLLDDHLR
jgi:hypothetical protein